MYTEQEINNAELENIFFRSSRGLFSASFFTMSSYKAMSAGRDIAYLVNGLRFAETAAHFPHTQQCEEKMRRRKSISIHYKHEPNVITCANYQ
jgi:hypothetical protein